MPPKIQSLSDPTGKLHKGKAQGEHLNPDKVRSKKGETSKKPYKVRREKN